METDALRTRTVVDTLDLWVEPDGGRLIKANLIQVQRAPSLPADFNERNWCQGLGEFTEAEYTYRLGSGRLGSGPLARFWSFDQTEEPDSYKLLGVICWNEGPTDGRVVWGRNRAESIGEDLWIRRTFTFTAFNEPLSLPDTLPENRR